LCLGLEGWPLPRDAGDQCRKLRGRGWGREPDGPPGDEAGLLFFGDSLEKIDHVGFADGEGGLVHASGMVHRTRLKPRPDDEGQKLLARCRWVVPATGL
jgi:hypothetical protein